MDYDFGEQASNLRARLREMVGRELPDGYLGAFTDDPVDLATAQRFCRRLAEEGLLTWSWPEEYGGSGGSVWEQTVVREEMWAHHEPRGAQYMGLNWVGPAIMAFGTEEQKDRFLPPIAAGDVIWCQGFSEPGAGSDLASLSTRADPDGDGFRISGQKIWTSYAQMAQWCVLAARVGPMGPKKHEGITIFLVPMDRDGITVRPIRSMLGPHHLNEVFLDSVRAEPEDVLGGVGNGWNVIRRALAHERVGIARYARCDRLMSAWAGDPARMEELPEFLRQQWVRALVAIRVARLLAYRAVADQEAGRAADVSASAARVAVTQCDQQVAELLFQAVEEHSLEAKGNGAPLHGAIEDHWRYAQAATVASGTIEIQRMIVSRALLAGSPR
ncbi:MAG TPA: acyl-CoA dehydrogenase family protein [Acidimicrobiales bacterium]|nr:acyl-CoA dehydrogenase family protein [Acidimicrobiales bacterium]